VLVNIDPGRDYYPRSVHVVEHASSLLGLQDLEEPDIQLGSVLNHQECLSVEYASTMLGLCLSP
jgi:hypothetical protein